MVIPASEKLSWAVTLDDAQLLSCCNKRLFPIFEPLDLLIVTLSLAYSIIPYLVSVLDVSARVSWISPIDTLLSSFRYEPLFKGCLSRGYLFAQKLFEKNYLQRSTTVVIIAGWKLWSVAENNSELIWRKQFDTRKGGFRLDVGRWDVSYGARIETRSMHET